MRARSKRGRVQGPRPYPEPLEGENNRVLPRLPASAEGRGRRALLLARTSRRRSPSGALHLRRSFCPRPSARRRRETRATSPLLVVERRATAPNRQFPHWRRSTRSKSPRRHYIVPNDPRVQNMTRRLNPRIPRGGARQPRRVRGSVGSPRDHPPG